MKVLVISQPRCVACGWIRCSGYISFGARLHEPHCASCLADWERVLRWAAGFRVGMALMLEDFRNWQRQRKEKMAA